MTDLSKALTVRTDSYVISFNPFTSCSYDAITHEIVYQDDTNIADFLVFDPTALTLTVKANANEFAGYYKLRYQAYVSSSPDFIAHQDFEITVGDNLPPYPILDGFSEDYILYELHSNVWTVELDFDPEGDTAVFDAILLDTTGTAIVDPSWFDIVSSNSTTLVFECTEAPEIVDPVNGDQYFINVTVADQFNADTPRVYQIALLVLPDTVPTLDTSKRPLDLGVVYVGAAFSFVLTADDFIDLQGDAPIMNCNLLGAI